MGGNLSCSFARPLAHTSPLGKDAGCLLHLLLQLPVLKESARQLR